MADISIQFHALTGELRDFVKQCVPDFELHVIAIRYHPYDAVELEPTQIEEAFATSSPYNELAFTLHRPNLPADGNLELWDQNPDILRLMVGKANEKGLKQSWLSTRTESATTFRLWKKIAKRLIKMTEKGVRTIDLKTGAMGPVVGDRYTAGAKALEATGVRMLNMGGTVDFKLGQTSDADAANE